MSIGVDASEREFDECAVAVARAGASASHELERPIPGSQLAHHEVAGGDRDGPVHAGPAVQEDDRPGGHQIDNESDEPPADSGVGAERAMARAAVLVVHALWESDVC